MLIRKIKNKLYTIFQNRKFKRSYIDTNAIISKSAVIQLSEIHGRTEIGENCKIYGALIGGKIKIGRYTSLWGPNIHVLAHNNIIEIGNFCSIARDVTIQEYFHDYNKLTTYFIGKNIFGDAVENESISKGNIIIGNDVWIGTGVQIMSGTTIGNGAVIAANATVTKDIPPYAIVAGAPAKIIKYRFNPHEIDILQKLEWWNWDLSKIKANKTLFINQFNISSLSDILSN